MWLADRRGSCCTLKERVLETQSLPYQLLPTRRWAHQCHRPIFNNILAFVGVPLALEDPDTTVPSVRHVIISTNGLHSDDKPLAAKCRAYLLWGSQCVLHYVLRVAGISHTHTTAFSTLMVKMNPTVLPKMSKTKSRARSEQKHTLTIPRHLCECVTCIYRRLISINLKDLTAANLEP